MFLQSQIPKIRTNDDLIYLTCPTQCIYPRFQERKFPTHGAVHASRTGVGFLQLRIQRDTSGDALQFNDGRSNHEGNVSRAVDGDDGLGIDASGVGDRTRRGGQGYGINILLVYKVHIR